MMTNLLFRRLALLACAAPLALALAACGSSDEVGELPKQDAIKAIAAPAGQAWVDKVATTPEGGYILGNPDAPIKLLEYGSHTCPACAAFAVKGMEPLRSKYLNSGRVNFEFRSVMIHGTVDLAITRLLACAPKEAALPLADQIWGNLDAVLDPIQTRQDSLAEAMSLPDAQRLPAFAERGGLLDFLASRGISKEAGKQCLSDFAALKALADLSSAQSEKDNVTGTPTFFLNGKNIGTQDWESLEPMLQNAGAR